MQIARQDFYFNLTGATNGRDNSLADSVVLNEMANIIAKSPSAVIAAINESGIPIKKDANASTIVNSIFKKGKNNDRLHKNLSKLVMLKNGYTKDTKFSVDGKTLVGKMEDDSASKPKKSAGDIWNNISSILGSLLKGSNNSDATSPPDVDKREDRVAEENRKQLMEMLNNRGVDTGMSAGAVIGFSIAAIAIVGLLIYVVSKSNK